MSRIIPIEELKNTSEISEPCHFYRDLELSERQIKEGKTSDARASLAAMRERCYHRKSNMLE
jgi:hypothetical protein